MPDTEETRQRLAAIPNLQVLANVSLSRHTRFGLGGPADLFVETADPQAFVRALDAARVSRLPFTVIGGGSNLVVADAGYRGMILKFSGDNISIEGNMVSVQAGAVLQDVVDRTAAAGLAGLETMTGIPGFTGAAIYGNAGAYGHSISESVAAVIFFDGSEVRSFTNAQCEFRYRESIFKKNKDWMILSAELALKVSDTIELQKTAAGILAIRNEKYPPAMKCAGSIFKNFLVSTLPDGVVAALPPSAIREGKVASAYFLEKSGAKGFAIGDIQVASYHANLIYNKGAGTAAELRAVIDHLKQLVWVHFGITLEEEVQYVGFGG